MFLASGGTDTIVTGPSPNTWYARLTSPLRAYRVGGTCCTSPVQHPTSQVARPLECAFAAPADGPRQSGVDARHRARRHAWRPDALTTARRRGTRPRC